MFSYGSPPVSSNRFGHNLLPALICAPTTIYLEMLCTGTYLRSTILDNIWFVTGEAQYAKDGSTPICYQKFLYVK
jgi:hypothetical protein